MFLNQNRIREMKNNKVVIILALIVCSLLVGGILGHHLFPKVNTEIIKIDSDKEKAKIDSLEAVIEAKEERIEDLLDSAKHIRNVVVVKEIERAKELDASESIDLLRSNLEKHGELSDPADSLPVAAVFDEPDTVAILSDKNVKDVNIIVAKYEGELEINDKLSTALVEGMEVVSQKDSIISLKDIIISNQEVGYSSQIHNLENNLKREKTKKTVWTAVLSGLAAIFGIIAITK